MGRNYRRDDGCNSELPLTMGVGAADHPSLGHMASDIHSKFTFLMTRGLEQVFPSQYTRNIFRMFDNFKIGTACCLYVRASQY